MLGCMLLPFRLGCLGLEVIVWHTPTSWSTEGWHSTACTFSTGRRDHLELSHEEEALQGEH